MNTLHMIHEHTEEEKTEAEENIASFGSSFI